MSDVYFADRLSNKWTRRNEVVCGIGAGARQLHCENQTLDEIRYFYDLGINNHSRF